MSTLDRQERDDMIMTYNILNHRVAMNARFMTMNTVRRTRGYTKKLRISWSQIEIRRNRITKRWNGLSQVLHIAMFYLSSPVDDLNLVGCVHHSLNIVNVIINSHMAWIACFSISRCSLLLILINMRSSLLCGYI